MIASAFSWLTAPKNPYPTTILWLCGLVLAVTSISAAAQQSIALSRLNSHPEGLRQIRRQLGGPVSLRSSTDRGEVVGRNVAWKPSLLQVYVWQVPVMMLNFSILMFLAGLGWSVWDAALKKGPTWEEDIKVYELFPVMVYHWIRNLTDAKCYRSQWRAPWLEPLRRSIMSCPWCAFTIERSSSRIEERDQKLVE